MRNLVTKSPKEMESVEIGLGEPKLYVSDELLSELIIEANIKKGS